MRSFWIKVHLYVATFFAPIIIVMAFSGGMYLLGNKGSVETTAVSITGNLDAASATLEGDVRQLLADNGIEHEFEYLKISGSTLITRPTSRTFYELKASEGAVTASRNEPDILKRLVELHKGHGPLLFKDLQKVMAVGLLIVLLSGMWLGLTSPALRFPSIIVTLAGTVIFVMAAFVI